MSGAVAIAAGSRGAVSQAQDGSASVLDVLDLFGPLASMHAALDAEGIGTPCGAVAFFEGRSVEELKAAIATARRRFPVLQTQLVWRRGRAVLAPHPIGLPGGVWEHRLVPTSDGVWFHGCWRHAAADGRSMLRFFQALEAELDGPSSQVAELKPRHPARVQPMAPWVCGFVADRQRRYVRMPDPQPAAPYGVSWLVTSGADRDRLLETESTPGCGFLGPLAAAAAAAFCHQQVGSQTGLVMLNVPVARDDLPELGGFGFGVGSLLMPVRLRPDIGHAELGREISKRTRELAASGFDRNLDRFLGRHPLRHRIFGAIRARSPADPAVTVSWKGRHRLGGRGGLSCAGCFAGSPTLHVSGHADRNGLSISVSSRQTPAARAKLLQGLAERLGLREFRSFDFEPIGPDPMLGCTARAKAPPSA